MIKVIGNNYAGEKAETTNVPISQLGIKRKELGGDLELSGAWSLGTKAALRLRQEFRRSNRHSWHIGIWLHMMIKIEATYTVGLVEGLNSFTA